jgi:hypothetical protein
MEAYVGRNFVQCSYPVHRKENGHEFDEEMGCHNTYHFDDVAIQRDRFDRNFQGTKMITTSSQRSMRQSLCCSSGRRPRLSRSPQRWRQSFFWLTS